MAEKTITLESPEVRGVVEEAETMLANYSGIQISNQTEFDRAGDFLKEIKTKSNQIDALQKSITQPLNEGLKRVREFFRHPLSVLGSAEEAIRRARVRYQQDAERERLAEEKRLKELALKEEERQRKLLERKAAKAEEAGDEAKAQALAAQASQVKNLVVPIVETQVKKTEGIAMKKIWRFRVVDANQIPREYLIPDEKTIGQYVRAMKDKASIPGVEIYSEDIEAVRTK